nr:probable ATP-dependent RNA helicase DDX31 [Anolis sagrei ordinatus]
MAACEGRKRKGRPSKTPEGAIKRSLDPPQEVVPPKRKLPSPQRKRKRKGMLLPQGSRPPASALKKPPNEGKGSKDNGGSSTVKTSSLFRNNPEIPEIKRIPVQQVQEKVFTSDSFDQLGLHPHLVSTITSVLKLSSLTSIQKQAIPVLLQGRDALVRSQTGSGKTLAYGIPLVQSLQGLEPKIQRSDGPYALILVPTRELALQSFETIQKLLKPFTWIVPGVLMGGEKKKSEKARLRKGINVLVATPGRLLDHLRSTQCLHFRRLKWLVLDEADRILDLGFEKAVATLLTALNAQGPPRQNVLLSATLTQGISRLSAISLRDPACISADTQEVEAVPVVPAEGELLGGRFAIPEGLRQEVVVVPLKLRLVTLAGFLLGKGQFEQGQKVVVFFSSCDQVDFHCGLFRKVLASGRSSPPTPGLRFLPLHGDMPQQERTSVFQDFLSLESGVLLCTVSPRTSCLRPSANGPKARPPLRVLSSGPDTSQKQQQLSSGCRRCKLQPSGGIRAEKRWMTALRLHAKGRPAKFPCAPPSPTLKGGVGTGRFLHLLLPRVRLGRANARCHFPGPALGPVPRPKLSLFPGWDMRGIVCFALTPFFFPLSSSRKYSPPSSLEGYIHRVGRTARMGGQGSSLLFLSPSETPFLHFLASHHIPISEVKMESILSFLMKDDRFKGSQWGNKKPHGPDPQEWRRRATAMQTAFEGLVHSSADSVRRAKTALQSFIRAYAAFPSSLRTIFCLRSLHLGHLAKSFGLRDAPGNLSASIAPQKQGKKQEKRKRDLGRQSGPRRIRFSEMLRSEYMSGLDPVSSQRKKRKRKQEEEEEEQR